MPDAPIGFFDSGLGGLTVRQEVLHLLPSEHTIYLADSAHAPYGEKSQAEILELSIKNTEWLIGQGCKLIVVACNTATTNAIAVLRREFDLPFVGIEPAIKPAALGSESKCVGVLATRGTLSSALFANTSRMYADGIEVLEREGTGLVGLIESGRLEDPQTKAHLKGLLAPMIDAGIDHLVLGCTHYPLLIPQLREILPDHIKIVDCSAAVALQTRSVLTKNGLLRSGESAGVHRVYTNGSLIIANKMLEWLGHSPDAIPLAD
jgi:glutamate racemase